MNDDSNARILAALERLEAGQTQMRVDIMGRIDRLQDAMQAIRDDIATNYGAAEAAQRANDNTRSELRALGDMVSSLVRQVRRLDSEVRDIRGTP